MPLIQNNLVSAKLVNLEIILKVELAKVKMGIPNNSIFNYDLGIELANYENSGLIETPLQIEILHSMLTLSADLHDGFKTTIEHFKFDY